MVRLELPTSDCCAPLFITFMCVTLQKSSVIYTAFPAFVCFKRTVVDQKQTSRVRARRGARTQTFHVNNKRVRASACLYQCRNKTIYCNQSIYCLAIVGAKIRFKTWGIMGKNLFTCRLNFNTFLNINMGYLTVVLLCFEQLSLFTLVSFKLYLAHIIQEKITHTCLIVLFSAVGIDKWFISYVAVYVIVS